MSDDDLTCRELVALVTDYLEGALPTSRIRLVDEHLALCDGCARYLAQMRATIRLLGTLCDDDVTPQAFTALRNAFAGLRDPPGAG